MCDIIFKTDLVLGRFVLTKKNISWKIFQKSSQAWKIVFGKKKTDLVSVVLKKLNIIKEEV